MTRESLLQAAATLMAAFGRESTYTPQKAVRDAVALAEEVALQVIDRESGLTMQIEPNLNLDALRKAGSL